METIDTPERAMFVIPHPDDGESGCGGTVAKWVAEGCKVLYVVCTNGNKGTSDPEMTMERLAATRNEEQRKAAEILGVAEVKFLDYGDGELEDTRDFRGQVVREIRRFKPDVLFAMDPYRSLSHSHRDHRISGQVAMDAAFPYARDTLHFEEHLKVEGLGTHKVETILLWGTENPDIAIDISTTLRIKLEALAAHASQLSVGVDEMEEFVKRWAQRAAERAEGTGFEYAETFRHVSFRRGGGPSQPRRP
jgi:LmbE family N-acetylglucosaminyl deacetylase